MEMKLSNSKLNEIAGQSKSIYFFLIVGLGELFMILGVLNSDFFALQINSVADVWNIIKSEILMSTGVVIIIAGFLINKGQLLNTDMYGYISKRRMKEILKNCEIVEIKLISKTQTKKVRRWLTPMTEYHFVVNSNNAIQARYGSFNNDLFKEDDSPTTNIHKEVESIGYKAYWNSEYPSLVVPAFLLEHRGAT